MATKTFKITEKLAKINDSFTVNRYDNGFMLEVSGYDTNEDWHTVKIVTNNLAELNDLIKEAITLPTT